MSVSVVVCYGCGRRLSGRARLAGLWSHGVPVHLCDGRMEPVGQAVDMEREDSDGGD